MEQERYWMWTKRKQRDDELGISPNVLIPTNNSYGESWEEQAFAEDAGGGPLGGCVWPPRSYSCSFCRREFKSAQALGGHMNVHRRDRARLKQSPNVLPHHAAAVTQVINLPQNPQICTYLYNPSFPDSDQEVVASSSPSSTNIRVSSAAPPTKDKTSLTPPLTFISPIIQEKPKLVADNSFHVLDFKDEDNFVKADLSISLNLLVCRNNHTNETEDHEEISNSKRRKIDASSFTLFPRSSTMERCSEVLKLSPNSMEDLDLELRLGDPPKVK